MMTKIDLYIFYKRYLGVLLELPPSIKGFVILFWLATAAARGVREALLTVDLLAPNAAKFWLEERLRAFPGESHLWWGETRSENAA